MTRSGGSGRRAKKLKSEVKMPPPPLTKNQKGTSKEADQVVGVEGMESSSDSKPTCLTSSGAAMNPLENPVILNHLFKFCSATELANSRLVCKQWYQESLVTWRTDFPITFTLESNQRLFLVNQEIEERTVRVRLQKFLEYCDNPKNQCKTKPYRYVKIAGCDLSLNPEQFQELWDALGKNLTNLVIYFCTFDDIEVFRKIIFQACPNLKTLNVDKCIFSGVAKETSEELEYKEPTYGLHMHLKALQVCPLPIGWMSPLPISWLELLSHFQYLTYLSVDFNRENSHFERLTDAIRTVRQHNPAALSFKCVDINPVPDISLCDPVSQTNIRIVQELRLPLKSLLLKVKSDMNESAVKSVLEFHAQTVTDIKLISVASAVLGQPFPFGVQLDTLTTLEIEEELCQTLSFLKYTPNLELLVIYGELTEETNVISNSCKQEMANVRMTHLVGLRLDFIVTDQDLASLTEWFPNVAFLEMPLNDKQFGIVCGSWKNMYSMYVKGSLLTDAGVTGMGNLEGRMSTRYQKKEVPRPNITHLKSLEKVSFWSNKLTDESVFHGFLHLPVLREIKFCSYHLNWGKEARKALTKRKIVFLQRTCCGFH